MRAKRCRREPLENTGQGSARRSFRAPSATWRRDRECPAPARCAPGTGRDPRPTSTPPAACGIGGDRAGDLALVEIVGAGLGEPLQGLGQAARAAGSSRRASAGRPAADRPAARSAGFRHSAADSRRRARDLHRGEPVDRQAFAGQRHGRRDQLAPRHAAEALDRRRIAAHRARDREGRAARACCGRPRPAAR